MDPFGPAGPAGPLLPLHETKSRHAMKNGSKRENLKETRID
jgi:hypothetical protein